jgi:hypothetical protein
VAIYADAWGHFKNCNRYFYNKLFMKKFISSIILLTSVISTNAQSQSVQKPCSSPEASQFDFWAGSWELTWNDTSKGTNTITKIMDGCTLHENFFDPVLNYKGESWSVYNPARKMWQQTWVDNGGAYIALTGKFENNEMTLSTQPRKLPDGKEQISRMVFSNITAKSFDWRWEASTDNGATWKPNWVIHYKRKV